MGCEDVYWIYVVQGTNHWTRVDRVMNLWWTVVETRMNLSLPQGENILISFAAFVVLTVALQKTRVSWNVTPCFLARSSGRFEGLSFLILRFKQSRTKLTAVRTFETSVGSRPTTHNMQEYLQLQGHYCVVRIERDTVQFSSVQFGLC